jgi:hypothetical protein
LGVLAAFIEPCRSYGDRSVGSNGTWAAMHLTVCVRMRRVKAAVNLLWVLLSLLGALALAHVVGVVNPTEKVNGL